MNDMSQVIIPKSDQINADDLLVGPKTITITKVEIRPGTEQPVSIFYEGDGGKPYKCCKSMARVMVHCWGADANQYVGRSMTLYCDPKVMWGGMAVGGIRISHMTHLSNALTMALTATKGNKKPFTVKPLVIEQKAAGKPALTRDVAALAMEAAGKGTASLRTFWAACTKQEQAVIKAQTGELKAAADRADAAASEPEDPFASDESHDPETGEIDDGDQEGEAQTTTPQRNAMWASDSYEIALPPDGKNQLPLWAQWFMQAAGDALSGAELMKLELDNTATMNIVKAKRTDLYAEIRSAIKAQHTVLAGAEGI